MEHAQQPQPEPQQPAPQRGRAGQVLLSLPLLLAAALALQGAQAAGDITWVTCGSTVKLAHSSSGARLHSHEVAYSRGSGQQSVTGYADSNDAQSYWIVHGSQDAPCTPGAPIRKAAQLRLQHATTRRWLHSHRFFSPITNNQEISCYGNDAASDGGDVWQVEWDSKSTHWKADGKVRLKHKDTGMFLSSNKDYRFGQPIAGQQEVCGVPGKGRDTEWYAAEGVYLPRSDRPADKAGSSKGEPAGKDGKPAAAAAGKGGKKGKEEL